jgi:MFS family permease
MSSFTEARTLTEYPHGARRWGLVILTVLATVLASYEFQLAPLLPLLLPDIHLSTIGYGYFITFALIVSAFAAFAGGPLADRYGRVLIIDLCLAGVTALVFANLLITDVASFIIIRTLMSVVGGLMAGAGAALVRDMSPRLSRALAFGLFTTGPVGANFLANFIAGLTLPIFHTWQSQIWIAGILGIGMYLPILVWLSDLSPELRLRVFHSEAAAVETEGRRRASAAELPSSAREAFAALLRHFEVWLMVVGAAANLTLYFTLMPFGPLMFTQAFHYSPAEAASLNAYFWFANLAMLALVGYVSDRLQSRKPIAIFGAVLSCGLVAWWIPKFGQAMPGGEMAIAASTLGCFLAIGYVPWAAQFSETLEDIAPALQATGWAFFGLFERGWMAIAAPLTLIVAHHYGWGKWVEVSLAGMIVYVVAMFFTRPGHGIGLRETRAPAQKSASA